MERVEINTGYLKSSVIPVSIRRAGNGGNIIRWSIKSEEISVIPSVDFFIVKAEKLGAKYVTGSCLAAASKSDVYTFIDLSNREFVGKIGYFIQPVYYDGSIGRETSAGFVLQRKRIVGDQ